MTSTRILAFAWEAGSAAAIAPVVRELGARGHLVSGFALEPARGILAERCPAMTMLTAPPGNGIDAILMGLGGPGRRDGIDAWRALKPLAPSLCVLDHWKGMDRFLDVEDRPDVTLLPGRVAVIDEPSRAALLRRGLAPEAVVVTGQPQLSTLVDSNPRTNGDVLALRQRLGMSAEDRIHVIASERLHDTPLNRPGGGSVSIAEAACDGRLLWQALLDEARAEDRHAVLLMRPHPMEGQANPTGLRMVDGRLASDMELLAVADRIYGVSSMLLVQAACLGIEAVNVAPRLDDFAPARCYLDEPLWQAVSAGGWFGRLDAPPPRPIPTPDAVQRVADAMGALTLERRH